MPLPPTKNPFIRPHGKFFQASGFISPDGYASRKGLWLPWALASSSPGGFFGYSMPPPMPLGLCPPRRIWCRWVFARLVAPLSLSRDPPDRRSGDATRTAN